MPGDDESPAFSRFCIYPIEFCDEIIKNCEKALENLKKESMMKKNHLWLLKNMQSEGGGSYGSLLESV